MDGVDGMAKDSLRKRLEEESRDAEELKWSDVARPYNQYDFKSTYVSEEMDAKIPTAGGENVDGSPVA